MEEDNFEKQLEGLESSDAEFEAHLDSLTPTDPVAEQSSLEEELDSDGGGLEDMIKDTLVGGLDKASELTGGFIDKAPDVLRKDVPEESEELDTLDTIRKHTSDFNKGLIQGSVKGVRNTINSFTELGGLTLPEANIFDERTTFVGQMAEGFSQYLPTALAISKLSKVGKLGKWVQSAFNKAPKSAEFVAGSIAGGLTFEDEEGLLNMLDAIPGLDGIGIQEDDSHSVKKTKQLADSVLAGFLGMGIGAFTKVATPQVKKAASKLMTKLASTKAGVKAVKGLNKVAEVVSEKGPTDDDIVELYKAIDDSAENIINKDLKIPKSTSAIRDDAMDILGDIAHATDEKDILKMGKGKINVDKINGPAETKALINKISLLSDEAVKKDPRILDKIKADPHGYSQDIQRALGIDEAEWMKAVATNAKGVEEGVAWAFKTRVTLNVLASDVITQADNIVKLGKQVNDAQLAKFVRSVERLSEVVPATKRVARGASDTLAVHKVVPNVELAENADELLSAVVNARGGKEKLREIAALAANFSDPMDAAAFMQNVVNKGYGSLAMSAIYETYVNAALASTKTIAINTLNGLIYSYLRPAEKIIGAAIDSVSPIVNKGSKVTSSSLGGQAPWIKGSKDVIKNQAKVLSGNATYIAHAVNMAKRMAKHGFEPIFDSSGRIGIIEKKGNSFFKIAKKVEVDLAKNPIAKDLTMGGLYLAHHSTNVPSSMVAFSDEILKQSAGPAQMTADILDIAAERGLHGAEAKAFLSRNLSKIYDEGTGALKPKTTNMMPEAIAKVNQLGLEGKKRERYLYLAQKMDDLRGNLHQVQDRGLKHARDVTFQGLEFNHGLSGKVLKNLEQVVQDHPWAVMFMPFRRTPIAIIRESAERIPGFGLLVNKNYAKLISSNPEARADAKGKQAVGSMVAMAALYWAHQEVITGTHTEIGEKSTEEPTKQARRDKEALGQQEHSFKVGGKNVSFRILEPYRTTLGFFADAYRLMNSGTKEGYETGEIMVRAFTESLMQNLGARDLLQGSGAFIDAIFSTDDSKVGRVAGAVATGIIPSSAKALSQLMDDDVIREAHTVGQKILKNIPTLRNKLPYARDPVGRPLKHAVSGKQKLVNPAAVTEEKKDIILEEMDRLGYHPLPYPYLFNNNSGFDLRDFKGEDGMTYWDEAAKLMGEVKIGGRTAAESLESLMKSSRYKRLEESGDRFTESPRKALIRKELQEYRSEVTKKLLRMHPELKEIQRSLKVKAKKEKRGTSSSREFNKLLDLKKQLKGE